MPKEKSVVWNYFIKDNTGKLAMCKNCYKMSGNTSDLRDHLKRKHSNLTRNSGSSSSGNELDSSIIKRKNCVKTNKLTKFIIERNKMYEINSQRKKSLDTKLAFILAVDFEPYSVVERKGFQEFVHALDPKYNIPSSSHLKNTIFPDLYISFTQKLHSILKDVKYISITTDIWSSINMEGYISSTCHFIHNCKLYSAALTTKKIQGSHTAEYISQVLRDIFIEWDLEEKVICVVTDNGFNIVSAINNLGIRHMACFAHTLNLIVIDCLKLPAVHELIEKCKTLVTYFKSSTKASDKLREEQMSVGGNYLKLIQSVPTRWNSVYFMLQRIIELKNILAVIIPSLPKTPPFPSCEEFDIICDCILCLECIQNASEERSGDSYITQSLIIPIIHGMYSKLNNIESKQLIKTGVGCEFLNILRNSMAKRLTHYETRTTSSLSTLLDPRIKKFGFKTADNATKAISQLSNELASVMRNRPSELEEKENLPTCSSTVKSNKSLLSFLDNEKH